MLARVLYVLVRRERMIRVNREIRIKLGQLGGAGLGSLVQEQERPGNQVQHVPPVGGGWKFAVCAPPVS
jgi:hypothetical protein